MNRSWASRDAHTSATVATPSSPIPPAWLRSPSGQSPAPVAASIPSFSLIAW